MTNLLPKKEKEALKKGLKLRFVIVVMFLLSAVFLVGFTMFLPSYFLASNYFFKATSGNYSSESRDGASAKEIMNLPEEINSKLSFFQSNTDNFSAADYFYEIVDSLPNGVRLNSVSFSKDQNYNDKNGIVILVSGIAPNRDSLISFSTLLKKSSSFSDVSVPVSSLTKDKNLPFSINIFIENK